MSCDSDSISAPELAARLGVKQQQIAAWRRAGMPKNDDGTYCKEDVAAWLIKKGLVESDDNEQRAPEVVAATIGEAATLLGIHKRTLAEYMLDPTFPGRAGRPGPGGEGYFPIRECSEWIATNRPNAVSMGNDELRDIQTEMARINLAKAREQILDADETTRFFRRTLRNFALILQEIGDRAAQRLPAELLAETREATLQVWRDATSEALTTLAELVEGDDDDTEDFPDDQ